MKDEKTSIKAPAWDDFNDKLYQWKKNDKNPP